MSIVSVTKLISGRSGTIQPKGERTYTRVYRVVTNDKADGPQIVRTASGVPNFGASYVDGNDADTSCVVTSKTAETLGDDPFIWNVSVNYTIPDGDSTTHPLLRAADISFGFEHFQTICERDNQGNGVTNSAGQYFDPPIEKDDSRPVLTVTRNQASFSGAIAIQYQDAVNIDFFSGAAPGQCKMFNISSVKTIEPFGDPPVDVTYWRTTYEIHFNRDGWIKRILDQGRYERDGDKLVQIKDKDDKHVTDPVLLDGNGKELPVETGQNVQAVFLPYRVYRELPFGPLGLPV